MKPLIKSLYIRLLSKELFPISAEEVEKRALEMMFVYRAIEGSTVSQLNFNFMANQRAYDQEKSVHEFIIRYRIDE